MGGVALAGVGMKKKKEQMQYNSILESLITMIKKSPDKSGHKDKHDKICDKNSEYNFPTLHEKEQFISNWVQKNMKNLTIAKIPSLLNHPACKSNESSLQLIVDRMLSIYYYHQMKQSVKEPLFIAFVGVHNSGKSTLIKSMWSFKSESIGYQKNTLTIEPHCIVPNKLVEEN